TVARVASVFFIATSLQQFAGITCGRLARFPGTRIRSTPGALKMCNVAGTNRAMRRYSIKCSNLERGESMKDPIGVFGRGWGLSVFGRRWQQFLPSATGRTKKEVRFADFRPAFAHQSADPAPP